MISLGSLSKYQSLVLPLGVAVLVILIVAMFRPYGQVGLTYDSYDLIEGSKDLHTYLTGKNKEGHSYLVRAPLHPIMLSFFENKILAIWWINLLSLVLSLVMIFEVCRLCELSLFASFTAVLVTGIFAPWLVNFEYAWTEPVFIVLILVLCLALLKRFSLLFIIFICFCLFATRKSGLFFFAGVSIFYLLDKKSIHCAILAVCGITTFFVWEWIEYSYGSSGYFTEMLPKLQDYSRVYYLEAVTSWFLPLTIPLLFRTLLVVSVFLFVIYHFKSEIFAVLRQRQNVVLLTLIVVYSTILISFRGISEYEDGERYLTILFPLCVVLGVTLASKMLERSQNGMRLFIIAGLVLWMVYISLRTAHHLFLSAV